VLVDGEAALVIKQAIQYVRGLVVRRGQDLRVIGPELIRQMRVELHAGLVTVVQIGVAADFTAAAGAEELSVRGGCGGGSPVARKRLAVLFIDER